MEKEKCIALLHKQLTKEATRTICMLESRDKQKWLAKILQESREVKGTGEIIKQSFLGRYLVIHITLTSLPKNISNIHGLHTHRVH